MKTPNRFRAPRKVQLGTITATSTANERLLESDVLAAICRQAHGDWGEAQDWEANDLALSVGGFVRGEYRAASGLRFVVQTDLSRGVTTVALPEDYARSRRKHVNAQNEHSTRLATGVPRGRSNHGALRSLRPQRRLEGAKAL